MLRILETYEVDKWIYTTKVLIESRVIPHSHPILTLSTRYLDNDYELLATFLHEQFHWLEEARKKEVKAAIAELKVKYPDVPVGNRRGARNEYSTYLHLLVCYWEYVAIAELLSKEKAQGVIQAKKYYTWVYEQVLAEEKYLKKLIKKPKLKLP